MRIQSALVVMDGPEDAADEGRAVQSHGAISAGPLELARPLTAPYLAELRNLLGQLRGSDRMFGACHRLMVLSAGTTEDVGFVTTSLAIAAAQGGLRTLLVDASASSAHLHESLAADASPGLSDFLEATDPAELFVQPTRVSLLDFIAAGSQPAGQPALMKKESLFRRLEPLGRRYDLIVACGNELAPDAIARASSGADHVIVVVKENQGRLKDLDAMISVARSREDADPVVIVIE